MSWGKKLLSHIRDAKVKHQLMRIYIIVVFIPILLIGTYLTQLMCHMVVTHAIDEAHLNIERIEDRLDEVIKIANRVADGIYMDEAIKTVLMTHFESYGKVVEAYELVQLIDQYLINYEELSNIRIYTTNTTLLNNSQFIQASDEIRKEDWYQEAVIRSGKIEWFYQYDELTKTNYLSLVRAIRDRHYGLLGVMVIQINPQKIASIIKTEPYDTLIAINQEVVMASKENEFLKEKLELLREKQNEANKIKVRNKEGVHYIIFKAYTPNKAHESLLEICMDMSVKTITNTTMEIIKKSFKIVLLCSLLSALLIWIFSKYFAERIILVRKEMHKVVMGDLNIRASIEGKDEIGELYGDIYTTVQSVKALVQENYEAKVKEEELKRRQKEIQFKMLASQMNPHFLYNTLETIRMKAFCNGQLELANVVKMLSKLLRRNLEVKAEEVSLQSEIESIKAYLEIQKFRFGDRVTYDLAVQVDPKSIKLLPLLIQPLVENAFVHGLEEKVGQGHIQISVFLKENQLRIEVEDNGIGIEVEALQLLQESLKQGKTELEGHLGIYNINQRIKLYYGNAYGLSISSKLGEGTKVTVNLPNA